MKEFVPFALVVCSCIFIAGAHADTNSFERFCSSFESVTKRVIEGPQYRTHKFYSRWRAEVIPLLELRSLSTNLKSSWHVTPHVYSTSLSGITPVLQVTTETQTVMIVNTKLLMTIVSALMKVQLKR